MNRFQEMILRAIGVNEVEERMSTQIEQRGGWEVYLEALKSNRASAGGSVTPGSSLRMAAVYACVRILAETVSSLPLLIYERQSRGKRRAQDYYLYELLHDQPNPRMTALEYRETVQAHLALWGNAYSRVVYDPTGRIQELWPLHPGNLLQTRKQNGVKFYLFQDETGKTTWYSEGELWNLRGLGDDGERGYSPIALMRRAVGLGLDAEEFGARFFANDARPGIVIEHPQKLSDIAHKHLKESWDEEHQGVEKSHKPMILEEGMKLHEVGIPPEDAQFLETRKFQVQEIARVFRIPPHMLADLDRATFSNIEQQSIEFVIYTLRPWLVRWEQSINRNLMLPDERARYYAEHLVDGLLRGDTTSRYQAYAVGRQNGWLSANDIRELENMDPIDGGDVYLVPLNMIPADQVGNEPVPAVARGREDPDSDISPAPTMEDIQITARGGREFVETRAKQAAAYRYRLAGRQQRVFQEISGRILRRERSQVMAQARKLLPVGKVNEFESYLHQFYTEHTDWAAREFLPYAQNYAEQVGDAVDTEIGQRAGLAEQADNFVHAYVRQFADRQALRSLKQLTDKIQQNQAAGNDALLEAIDDETNEWIDSRSVAVAHEESIRENNAVAVALYSLAGIRKIVSIAMGASSCPYCKSLDGKTIGITEYFLKQGQVWQPEGADSPMTISHNMRHPPYHGACDCMTVAGG